MALKRGVMADLVGECIKSPVRAMGPSFRINVLMNGLAPASSPALVISVPKRWVKRAIDRNTIKRLGRVWWDRFVQDLSRDTLALQIGRPRMAFVQITPQMLDSCRSKKAGDLHHGLWKQQLAAELQGLGEKILARRLKWVQANQTQTEPLP